MVTTKWKPRYAQSLNSHFVNIYICMHVCMYVCICTSIWIYILKTKLLLLSQKLKSSSSSFPSTIDIMIFIIFWIRIVLNIRNQAQPNSHIMLSLTEIQHKNPSLYFAMQQHPNPIMLNIQCYLLIPPSVVSVLRKRWSENQPPRIILNI